uniref:Uncharacterized protein n=1 Tax=Tetranychus urticae TaxID=32264 RepID=T1KT37_TETUR
MRIILAKFSFVNLICTIGCFLQIYDITRRFLQFKVRSDVSYKYSNVIELPAIDLMIPLATAINFTKIFNLKTEMMISICKSMVKTNSENFTLKQIIESCENDFKNGPIMSSFALCSFITIEDIEKSADDPRDNILAIIWGQSSQDILKESCQLSRYFSGYAIYVRISCLQNSKPFNMSMDTATMSMKIFGALHNTLRSYYGLRFADPSSLPEPDFTSYFIIDHKLGEFPVAAASYTKTITKSLRNPYETECQYYDKVKSMFECLLNSSLKQKNPFLVPTMVYEWGKYPSNLGFKPTTDLDGNYNDEIPDEILKHCTQKFYANECEKVAYRVEGKIYPGKTKNVFGIILLEPPRTPTMYLKAYPKLQWSEYLIFVGSILGIWFGFSVSDQLIKSIQYIKSRSKKMKQESKFQNEIETVLLSNTIQYWNQLANQKGKQKNDKILWASSKYKRDHLRSRY